MADRAKRPTPRRRRARGTLARRGPRSGRRTRLIWPILASVLLAGVLFVAVFPTQTLLQQRSEADEKQVELEEIEQRNAELERRVEELNDPAYLELLAREDFGLVRPGEESYIIVPPAEEE